MRPFRNYLLEISEIEETENFNIFGLCLRMMKSLRDNEITSSEFDGLGAELEFQSKRLGISTECEELNLSLF